MNPEIIRQRRIILPTACKDFQLLRIIRVTENISCYVFEDIKNPPPVGFVSGCNDSSWESVKPMKCIHRPDRLSVIPSELAPLLDVIPVGVEVQADEVLDQPRCAHALPSEETDNPVKFVTHRFADEHGLAVDNLGNLEIGGAVLLQRQPALLAADTLLRYCRSFGRHT